MKTKLLHLALGWLLTGLCGSAHAQSTAITYQGVLSTNGAPANVTNDFTFSLFGVSSGGSALAGPLTNLNVRVTNGLFTAAVDFGPLGDAFYANDRWLEIATRPAGAGAFVTLSPRQPITATPRALYASYASAAAGALTLNGPLPSVSLSGNYPQTVSITNPANQFRGSFTGNGGGLTNLNASQLTSGTVPDARLAANVARTNQIWLLGGNAGTTQGVHFIGTTDERETELRANNTTALRLSRINTTAIPNLIGGFGGNSVAGGAQGTVIGGGGGPGATNRILSGNITTISGGSGNTVSAEGGVIGGGNWNSVSGQYSAVSGGQSNSASFGSAVIAGGDHNTVANDRATVSGGYSNRATGPFSAVGGGNINLASGEAATVPGGSLNTASGNYSTAMGNHTTANGAISTAMGNATTASGNSSTAMGDFTFANGDNSTAMGTWTTADGAYSTAIGHFTFATGNDSTAMGYGSRALHLGSFVWADAQGGYFDSTGNNQFLLRASGGVGINTTSPAAALDINGSIRVGGGGTVIQRLQSGQAQVVGGSGTARTNLTITFPTTFTTPPKILVSAANAPGWDVDDTFAVSVRRTTTTNCVVNIMRVDINGAWSQPLLINWQAWE